jgi:hypothetical protein
MSTEKTELFFEGLRKVEKRTLYSFLPYKVLLIDQTCYRLFSFVPFSSVHTSFL